MKKTLFLLSITGMAGLIACGPGAEQKAAAEKAKADSMAAIKRADSLTQVANKQRVDDSTKAAQMKAKAADTVKPAGDPTKDGH